MRASAVLVLLLLFSLSVHSQEFNCTITINSDQIQGSNKSVFTTLQKSLNDFINNRKWSDLSMNVDEKIECSMTIMVKKVDGEVFSSDITVQARRPVFNSTYFTTLFNHKDNDLMFQYKEFDILEINENSISSNLTAVVSYYLYLILGMDMDSFSRLGGTGFFQKAEQIVNMAQSTDMPGWKAFESTKNRYSLINNLTDESFKKFRNYFYEYHRLGLDEMSDNLDNARARMLKGLAVVREANRARPASALIPAFFDSKSDELFQIMQGGKPEENKAAVEIITDINPSLTTRFETLTK